ncbi:MAG: fused DSP-PTPase phosphatase/NAD kinase-like protein [bacterium]
MKSTGIIANCHTKAWFPGLNGIWGCVLVSVLLVGMIPGISETMGDSGIEPRPAHWAQPLEYEGLPNLYKVSDDLYRGAQPTAEGMRRLKELGIKTVINLRTFHSDKDEIDDTGLENEHIRVGAWYPSEKDIVHFLQIVTDKERTPVFVHCMHGADRTGVMVAVYRVVVCGWSKQDAIAEMTTGGFGYHRIWTHLVKLIEDLDADAIREKVGIGDGDAGRE